MRDLNKFRGCLIGGAAGDALGYAVEFLQAPCIFEKYGKNGITSYDTTHGIAKISDDTQMTMFTANGLLFGTTRGMTRGIMGPYQGYLLSCYKDWLRTQEESFPLPEGYHTSWLVNIGDMFCRRAPGMTCLSAIRQGAGGSVARPVNNSKGCGGVMRVAPIGLYFNDKAVELKDVDLIGAEAAAITHGHELGYIPAAALVHMISMIAEQGAAIMDAVTDAMNMMLTLFPNARNMDELQALISRAMILAAEASDDLDAIRQLGEGWVAEETLAIAVYCALKYQHDFDQALIASVNHSGDSDSTGAVTGNLLGAFVGYDRIPEKYKQNLELKDVILELADDLYHDCRISEYGSYRDEVWEQKYIDGTYDKFRSR